MRLDCRDRSDREVPASPTGAIWAVVYSGLSRKLAAGGYGEKVTRLRRCLARAKDSGYPSDVLRFLSPHSIGKLISTAGLDAEDVPLIRHVVSENARVHLMRYALERADCTMAGRILQQGHDSLSTQFRVSTPALDDYVSHASGIDGVYGIRLTGAGMGGSLVALLEESKSSSILSDLDDSARSKLHPDARVYAIPGFCDGVRTWTP